MKKILIIGAIIVVIIFSAIGIKYNLHLDNSTVKYFKINNIETFPNGQASLKEYLPNKYKLTSSDREYLKDNKVYKNLINYNIEAEKLATKGINLIDKNTTNLNELELNFSDFFAKTYVYYKYPITENQKNIVSDIIKISNFLNDENVNTVGELSIQEKTNLKKLMQKIKKLANEQ